MRGGRIDPSSCLDTCWVDDMAVWWFRATCFHGLKYLCVNREVLKQNFIMRTEMKASSECLYPTDVFLISCGMGCKRITVSDIAYIEAMKDNCVIHMIDGKRYTQSCPMGDIEPELNLIVLESIMNLHLDIFPLKDLHKDTNLLLDHSISL